MTTQHPSTLLDREPVRLPVWASTLMVAAINLAIDLLSDVNWRTAAIGVLVTVGGLFGAGELARSRSYSSRAAGEMASSAHNAGREIALAQVRALVTPEPQNEPDKKRSSGKRT